MTDSGFSIRCPHCLDWSDWNIDPGQVAVCSEDEFRSVLAGKENGANGVTQTQLLRCQQPSWRCPVPFEAVVCRSEVDALKFVQIPAAWSLRRDFRLYRQDHVSRWDNYFGILFCVRPVARQRHIEMVRLLDEELLRRTLVGLAKELGSPVTVYVANAFETRRKTEIVWVPIESYTHRVRYVPEAYNPLCELCRNEMLQALLNRFEQQVSPEKCPESLGKRTKCGGRDAKCLESAWNECPAFLRAREKLHMCYWSDLKLIRKVLERWQKNAYDGPTGDQCWAGLTEIALPIIVHDHLVAVLMTGQLVVDHSPLIAVADIMEKSPRLATQEARLVGIRNALMGTRPETSEEMLAARFRIDKEAYRHLTEQAETNARRLSRAGTVAYRNLRYRSESIFKEEILGRLAKEEKPTDLGAALIPILERFKEFWAFDAIYLVVSCRKVGDFSVIAFSSEFDAKSFTPGSKPLGQVRSEYLQEHPLPFLFDRDNPEHPWNPHADEIVQVFQDVAKDPELCIPPERFVFGVLVPYADHLFAVVLTQRDKGSISPLPPRIADNISEVCQEAILDTSTAVIERMGHLGWFDSLPRD